MKPLSAGPRTHSRIPSEGDIPPPPEADRGHVRVSFSRTPSPPLLGPGSRMSVSESALPPPEDEPIEDGGMVAVSVHAAPEASAHVDAPDDQAQFRALTKLGGRLMQNLHRNLDQLPSGRRGAQGAGVQKAAVGFGAIPKEVSRELNKYLTPQDRAKLLMLSNALRDGIKDWPQQKRIIELSIDVDRLFDEIGKTERSLESASRIETLNKAVIPLNMCAYGMCVGLYMLTMLVSSLVLVFNDSTTAKGISIGVLATACLSCCAQYAAIIRHGSAGDRPYELRQQVNELKGRFTNMLASIELGAAEEERQLAIQSQANSLAEVQRALAASEREFKHGRESESDGLPPPPPSDDS